METGKFPEQMSPLLEAILSICWKKGYLTIDEMAQLTEMHPYDIRRCLRKIKNSEEAGFVIKRRKRDLGYERQQEYCVKRKPAQLRFSFNEHQAEKVR